MVIVVIIGVLSIFATARFSGSVERTRAFYDELGAQVRYARKIAVAQRRQVCVHVGAGQSQLFYSSAAGDACPGAAGVAGPTGEAPFTVDVPAGTSVTAATFQFDALGRSRGPSGVLSAAPLVINVTGDGTYQLSVQHETGYVQ